MSHRVRVAWHRLESRNDPLEDTDMPLLFAFIHRYENGWTPPIPPYATARDFAQPGKLVFFLLLSWAATISPTDAGIAGSAAAVAATAVAVTVVAAIAAVKKGRRRRQIRGRHRRQRQKRQWHRRRQAVILHKMRGTLISKEEHDPMASNTCICR